MPDNEVQELIGGWAFALGGLFVAVLCAVSGLYLVGIGFCVVSSIGFVLLIETFWHYQAPLIPETLRNWRDTIWTR